MAEAGSNESNPEHLLNHLRNGIIQPDVPEEDFVRIMSLQKSKGLSSKVVIVTGCVEGLTPFTKPDWTAQEVDRKILEYRRLFYVAITRSEKILVLSSFTKVQLHDAGSMNITLLRPKRFNTVHSSRFLSELGNDAPFPVNGQDWENTGYEKLGDEYDV